MSLRSPAPADDVDAPDLEEFGLSGFDADALIRSSSYCAMVHAAHQLGHEIAPALSELKLTPTLYLVLGQVLSAPGSSPAELARRCSFLPQTMASIVQTLDERGLVQRHGERGRGRTTRLTITKEGVDLLAAGWPIVHGAGGGRLTDTQDLVLRELLAQMRGEVGAPDDVVVLVDEEGRDCGTAPRSAVHTTETPLHRAFSTYLRSPSGEVLLTRRSVHKKTWPGVWTNSACGHLKPGEDAPTAAMRRVPEELGVTPRDLRVVLPDFRYRAVDASGIVEHEVCPVMVGEISPEELALEPDEVAEHAWVRWEDVRAMARSTPFALSPWCVAQIEEMGDRPW